MNELTRHDLYDLEILSEMDGFNCNHAKYDYRLTFNLNELFKKSKEIQEEFYKISNEMNDLDFVFDILHQNPKLNIGYKTNNRIFKTIMKINDIDTFYQLISGFNFKFLKKRAQNKVLKEYNKFINIYDKYTKYTFFINLINSNAFSFELKMWKE